MITMRINLCLFVFLGSCATKHNDLSSRVVLAESAVDQSSAIDTNGDKIPDIERWYRGSQIVFEKIDTDHDGFWDIQGRRHSDDSFSVYIDYPKGKYSVKNHHMFYATSDHPKDITILAR